MAVAPRVRRFTVDEYERMVDARVFAPHDRIELIEVMDTSVDYDRRTKAPLYARAGVGELWLVDIPAGLVEVHRDPAPAGYRDVRTLGAADTVTPRAFSDLTLGLPEILG